MSRGPAPASSPSSSSVSDSDYETEEETLVHVEVGGILQEDLSLAAGTRFKFIDIESAQPLVQIGNQVFQGSYQPTLGTSLFFSQEDHDPGSSAATTSSTDAYHDPVFSREPRLTVQYLASARKKLRLKRIFLKDRSGAAATAGATDRSEAARTETSEPSTAPRTEVN